MKQLIYIFLLLLSHHTYTVKIVGLVAGCNEGAFLKNCLRSLAQYTDGIVYLDYHSLDESMAIVQELKDECNIECIFPYQSLHHTTNENTNMLLQMGRLIGGTHFVVVSPTEMFSASCLYNNNSLKKLISNLSPGQSLALPYAYVADNVDCYYKQKNSSYHECIFADDGVVCYKESDSLVPTALEGKKWFWENDYKYVLLNFEYNDTKKQLLHQAFCTFFNRMNHFALPSLKKNICFDAVEKAYAPYLWYKGYEQFFIPDASYNNALYEAFICNAITMYGIDFFTDINTLSAMNWNHILNEIPKESNFKSQYRQDVFMDTYVFRQKKKGIYIDIGAHDGDQWSNTSFFEKERQWKGICIEPLTEAFEQLKKNRSAICLNACVGSYDGIANFYRVEGAPEQLSGLVDTYHPSHKQRMEKEVTKAESSYVVEQKHIYTLNTILQHYNLKYVDYISIDTEGSEWEIIKAIDFDRCYIKAMSIENMYHGDELRAYLQSKGFQYVARLYDCDDIFINTKREHV